jgi:hypothetical protein
MTEQEIKYIILLVLALAYLIYTVRYSVVFEKNVLFKGHLKTFHFIMIWLIPFVWIFILKILTKSTPGSHEIENKKDSDPFFDAYKLD